MFVARVFPNVFSHRCSLCDYSPGVQHPLFPHPASSNLIHFESKQDVVLRRVTHCLACLSHLFHLRHSSPLFSLSPPWHCCSRGGPSGQLFHRVCGSLGVNLSDISPSLESHLLFLSGAPEVSHVLLAQCGGTLVSLCAVAVTLALGSWLSLSVGPATVHCSYPEPVSRVCVGSTSGRRSIVKFLKYSQPAWLQSFLTMCLLWCGPRKCMCQRIEGSSGRLQSSAPGPRPCCSYTEPHKRTRSDLFLGQLYFGVALAPVGGFCRPGPQPQRPLPEVQVWRLQRFWMFRRGLT